MTHHDIVVVGGGAAGLVVAFGAAAAGADVALIEADRLGGECTWTGCIPSKTLIDAARRVHEANNSQHLGIRAHEVTVDFPALMNHVHEVSSEIAAEEGAERVAAAGISLYRSFARFIDDHTLALSDGSRVSGRRVVLATGGRPVVPEPLTGVRHLTNETIWNLTELPDHLVVVGGGAVGCELGQAFHRLGSDVTIVSDAPRLIPNAHPDAAAELAAAFGREGIDLRLGHTVISAADSDASMRLALDDGSVLAASHLLVATGRSTSITHLDPGAAGIAVSADGAPILDRHLRTTSIHIYVCGDAAGAEFTHIAGKQAAGVLVNLFSPRPLPVDIGVHRWAIFTDPEIAQVGPVAFSDTGGPQRSNGQLMTRIPMTRSDRAAVQSAPTGFIEARHSRYGKLESVTIVGPNAAELANQWIRPISKGSRMTTLAFADTIYPTMGSTNQVVAYEWGLSMLNRRVVGTLTRWAGRLRTKLMRVR